MFIPMMDPAVVSWEKSWPAINVPCSVSISVMGCRKKLLVIVFATTAETVIVALVCAKKYCKNCIKVF